jgi:hypothetical protein
MNQLDLQKLKLLRLYPPAKDEGGHSGTQEAKSGLGRSIRFPEFGSNFEVV